MTETTFEQPAPEPEDRRRFDAEPWRALGMTREAGLAWWKHRILPGDALRWERAGVPKPIDAVRWKIAGIAPDTVREWIYAEIDAREAVAWTELGFSVADARKNKRAGRNPVQAYGRNRRGYMVSPPGASVQIVGGPPGAPDPARFLATVRHGNRHVTHSYLSRQWFDDEAIAWATHGIDAVDALAWKELGLTPVEAERHQANGMSAMQVAKAWWQAGIPLEEFADWIGAGLTPEEAAEQRAKGVSVERAAVLRSLRKRK